MEGTRKRGRPRKSRSGGARIDEDGPGAVQQSGRIHLWRNMTTNVPHQQVTYFRSIEMFSVFMWNENGKIYRTVVRPALVYGAVT